MLVHHYIDGTQNRVPSKNGGEVEDEIISGKVDDQYSTRESSNIANNYELITSKLPENANGVMTESQIVVTYYYQLKDPTLDTNISKTSTLNKVTSKDQEIPYTITYTANIDTYIGDAEVIIVDTLPYKIDEAKSDIAGGTYNDEAKTITWEENITGIDSFASTKNQINITKEIKLVYKDLDVNQQNITNNVTGTINLKTPEKTDTVKTIKEIPTEYLKDVKVTKVWEDNNNAANKRPTNVTAVLTGDGKTYKQQLSEENATIENNSNWEYTFINLPKYNSIGEEINYVLSEEGSNKFYLTNIDQENKIITNTFTIPDEKISIKVTKVWDDNNNSAGKRPEKVTLVLTGDAKTYKQELTAENADKSNSNNWIYTFNDLAKYDVNGNEIQYELSEENLNSKFYSSNVNQENKTVTNTFNVPDEKVSIKVTKTWNDNNNEAGKRPESVTLKLSGNGKEYTQEVNASNAASSNKNNWEYTFTDLPKYDENGDEITYTIDELDLHNDFYIKSSVNQDTKTIVNTFQVPGENVTIPVTKIWDDNNDKAKKRPESVTVQVKNGEEVVAESPVTADTGWKYEFTLPKFDNYGNEINYTIDETDLNNKYYEKGNVDQSARTITNVSKYGKVTVHYYIEGTTTRVPDINGSEIEDVLIEGKQGDSYNTNAAKNVKQNYELVTTPANSNGIITVEDTEVIYYYKLKTPSVTNQVINKTGTDKITVANQEISYEVTYRAEITDYIGNAEVTIVDTLPYEIDEEHGKKMYQT